jgi:hypothetical protein
MLSSERIKPPESSVDVSASSGRAGPSGAIWAIHGERLAWSG